ATAALAMSTVVRNQEYASGLKLAETTLARWPSPTAHAMVGGELAALGRDLEALPELRIAAPLDPRARYNLGITHFNLGDDAQAIRESGVCGRRYLAGEEIPLGHRALVSANAGQRKGSDAAAEYRAALAMVPADRPTRELLIETLFNRGKELAGVRR